jgi:hypothetical protein
MCDVFASKLSENVINSYGCQWMGMINKQENSTLYLRFDVSRKGPVTSATHTGHILKLGMTK